MILTCTGGRGFADRQFVFFVLDGLHALETVTTVRHGGAPGADQLVDGWARSRMVPCQTFVAYWVFEGKKAGPRRNARMLAFEPVCDGVVAFPGGTGTADCVSKARKHGVPVFDTSDVWLEGRMVTSGPGESIVAATRALMAQMEADSAVSGSLTLDLGGIGDLPAELEPFRSGTGRKGLRDGLA